MAGRGEQVTDAPAALGAERPQSPPGHPPTPTGIQAPSGVTGNPPRLPAEPTPSGTFKQSQIILAVAVLIVMVFIVTFAMNYLGGGAKPTPIDDRPPPPRRELAFAWKVFPPDGLSSIDREHRASGHVDYWFTNPHDAALTVGLVKENCKCTEVRLFYLPEDGHRRLVSDAVALFGVGAAPLPLRGPAVGISPVALHALALPTLQKGASEFKLLRDREAVTVPAKAVGWIQLGFKGEKPGPISLQAVIWTEHKETGGKANLESRVTFHEAIRVLPTLQVGALREPDLASGVTRYITCWSPTRSRLNLDARPAFVRRGGDKGDPFHVGKAEPLGPEEIGQLQRDIVVAAENDPLGIGGPVGQVLSAYRIPVTLKAVSDDGRTPFDIGPFRRRVVISSPEVDAEPKSVVVLGRVQGLIELGGTGAEEEGGEVNFRVFPGNQGKRERITLSTDVPDLKLAVDEERTSAFLKAKLDPLPASGATQRWRLTIEVLPGKAFGPFPRKDDPGFEDCAVYLKAAVGKEVRPVRIAVGGMASS